MYRATSDTMTKKEVEDFKNILDILDKKIKSETTLNWLVHINDSYDFEFFLYLDLEGKELNDSKRKELSEILSKKNICNIFNTTCWHNEYYKDFCSDDFNDMVFGFFDQNIVVKNYLLFVLFFEDYILKNLEK